MAGKVTTKELKKVEDEELRDYELILIFSPEVAEDVLDAALAKVHLFITERGGTLSTVEQWGKRRFAYPLQRFVEGSYVLTSFKLTPKLTKELEANLHISEEILRHLLVRLDS